MGKAGKGSTKSRAILGGTLETISIKPRKTDILVQLDSLAWAPCWQDARGSLTPAW